MTMSLPSVGFSSWAFPGEDINYSIDHALSHRFVALEVALLDPALFNREDLIPSDDQARKVAIRTNGLRLSVHAPIDQVHLADPEPEVRKESLKTMRRAIDAAHLMNAEVVVCHLSRKTRNSNLPLSADERGRAFALDHLHDLGIAAAGANIVLGIENVGISNRAADRDYAGLCDLVDRIGLDNVGITFDVGHAHVHRDKCGGVATSAELFGSRIRHYHVHDNNGTADQHRCIGSGTIEYSSLLPTWVDGYEGIITMEIFPFIEADLEAGTLASRSTLVNLLKNYQKTA
jgi:sugar phosphate isomerase/epimerase